MGSLRGIRDLSLPMPLFGCVRGARRCVYFKVLCPPSYIPGGLQPPTPAPKSLSASLGKQRLRIKGFKFTAGK